MALESFQRQGHTPLISIILKTKPLFESSESSKAYLLTKLLQTLPEKASNMGNVDGSVPVDLDDVNAVKEVCIIHIYSSSKEKFGKPSPQFLS